MKYKNNKNVNYIFVFIRKGTKKLGKNERKNVFASLKKKKGEEEEEEKSKENILPL